MAIKPYYKKTAMKKTKFNHGAIMQSVGFSRMDGTVRNEPDPHYADRFRKPNRLKRAMA